MMFMKKSQYMILTLLVLLFFAQSALGNPKPKWTVPRFGEPPATWDGAHVVEGTATASKWSWHARAWAR